MQLKVISVILGVVFFALGIFLIKTIASMKETAEGYIVGYGHGVPNRYGITARTYRVRYSYKGKEYLAVSMESVLDYTYSPKNAWDDDNFHQYVTVKFNPARPDIVAIVKLQKKWLKWEWVITIMGLALVVFGVII